MKQINFQLIKKNKLKIGSVLFLLSYIIICQSCMMMRISSKETKLFFDTSKTKFKDSTIIVNQIPIHYLETGNPLNPTLFFIHGSPGSWNAYQNYLKDTLLLKKFRMIAIDRPGFGYSNFGKAENLGTQANLIEILISKIKNNKNIFLVGHSLGGPIIVKMATDKPTEYNGLVIIAGSIDPDAEEPENWRPILISKPIRYLIPGALRPSNDELWWLKEDLIRLKPNLHKIVSDVLIIHGTKDQLVPFSNVAFMRREFINAKTLDILSIKNANHFIPWENFETIRDKLLDLK